MINMINMIMIMMCYDGDISLINYKIMEMRTLAFQQLLDHYFLARNLQGLLEVRELLLIYLGLL